ncbi:hypothetical protein ACXX82_00220 [Glaciimonas sp. GNP009]
MTQEKICARVTLNDESVLRADLSTGESETGEVEVIVNFLLRQGVPPENVLFPDWRDGDQAPTGGQKIAIMHQLRSR